MSVSSCGLGFRPSCRSSFTQSPAPLMICANSFSCSCSDDSSGKASASGWGRLGLRGAPIEIRFNALTELFGFMPALVGQGPSERAVQLILIALDVAGAFQLTL